MDENDIRADEEEPGDEEAQPSSGRGRKILTLVVAVVGLLGGGAIGMRGLSPKIAPMLADRAESSSGGHGAEGGDAASSLHMIDNLVVNPARSGGSRFLLTSIAVEVVDPTSTAIVERRDVEIRDALIVVLGSKTVDELSDISLRPRIANEIGRAIVGVVGPDIVRDIYIPQFVIQ